MLFPAPTTTTQQLLGGFPPLSLPHPLVSPSRLQNRNPHYSHLDSLASTGAAGGHTTTAAPQPVRVVLSLERREIIDVRLVGSCWIEIRSPFHFTLIPFDSQAPLSHLQPLSVLHRQSFARASASISAFPGNIWAQLARGLCFVDATLFSRTPTKASPAHVIDLTRALPFTRRLSRGLND